MIEGQFDTDFPDIRSMAYIVPASGKILFTVPRENDMIRWYIQQDDTADLMDPETGRVDKNRSSPEELLEQTRKIVHPYKVDFRDGKLNWWTLYVGQWDPRWISQAIN